MSGAPRFRVLFVCMGNICRSPVAEGLLREKLRKAGLDQSVELDSAGTHDYHLGHPPDPRGVVAAHELGVDIGQLRSRQVNRRDFEDFDWIVAMDQGNRQRLEKLRPASAAAQLFQMTHWLNQDTTDIADPYYGEQQDFEQMLEHLDRASDAMLEALRVQLESGKL